MQEDRFFPLVCLEYVPGRIDEAVAALKDPLTRDAAQMELDLFRGDGLRALDEANALIAKDDLSIRLTASVTLGFALASTGDAAGAIAALRKKVEEAEHPRERLLALMSQPSNTEDPATVHELSLQTLAGDIAAARLGLSQDGPSVFNYLSVPSLSDAQRMLGCISAAVDALSREEGAYSAGWLSGIITTSRKRYPLLVAMAQLLYASDQVLLGNDAHGKEHFMEAFEVLNRDGLYQPIAGLYCSLMGLPDACLRKKHAGTLRKIQHMAQNTANLYQGSDAHSGWLAASSLLKPQESSFVQLAALGKTNDEIAAFMGVTAHTVKYHLSNAYAKLNIEGRAQLVPPTRGA